jgi:hypothetical protein
VRPPQEARRLHDEAGARYGDMAVLLRMFKAGSGQRTHEPLQVHPVLGMP